MAATKKPLFIFMVPLLFGLPARAQQCGNCNTTPSVIQYDLDVQVPPPNDNDSSSQQWLEWRQLFWLNKHVSANIFNENKTCVRFLQASFDEEIKVGETATNLVNDDDLTGFAGYFTTGYIKKNGERFLMHMELQTSCSRQTVVSSDINFNYSADAAYIMGIAQQAASDFSPLIDKIRQFEIKQRAANKKLSINSFEADPIKIIPSKKTLKPGESTDVTLELKDCDGTPLEGREIIFTETNFNGLKVSGTKGGSVSPAKVITDAQGKANVKFTLSSNSKDAVIRANSIGTDVRGCPDIFAGEAAINVEIIYSGFVNYSYILDQPQCSHTVKSETSVQTVSSIQKESLQYKGIFVSGEKPEESGLTITLNDDDDENVPGSMQSGNYQYSRMEMNKHVVSCVCAANGEVTYLNSSVKSSGKLNFGQVFFSIDEKGNLQRVSLTMQYKTITKAKSSGSMIAPANETKDDEYQYNIDLENGNTPNMKMKKEQKGSKMVYTIDQKETVDGECPYSWSLHLVLTLNK